MKIVGGVVQGSTVTTVDEGEQVVPLSMIRHIVREELAAQRERPVEIISLSDEQKAQLAEGIAKLSAEGYPNNVIHKQDHIFNK